MHILQKTVESVNFHNHSKNKSLDEKQLLSKQLLLKFGLLGKQLQGDGLLQKLGQENLGQGAKEVKGLKLVYGLFIYPQSKSSYFIKTSHSKI